MDAESQAMWDEFDDTEGQGLPEEYIKSEYENIANINRQQLMTLAGIKKKEYQLANGDTFAGETNMTMLLLQPAELDQTYSYGQAVSGEVPIQTRSMLDKLYDDLDARKLREEHEDGKDIVVYGAEIGGQKIEISEQTTQQDNRPLLSVMANRVEEFIEL